jgi:Na+-transporting methylmalonyl-CoA/oxaloacetate decarboxylase gamma subunit
MLPLAIPLNDDTVSPGFLGFGVFIALLVALVFLIRSMNKQIRKIEAPREADLKQQEWEAAQAAKKTEAVKTEAVTTETAKADTDDGGSG